MEANFVIKVGSLTEDFVDGIMKVFSKDALLNITVNYDLENGDTAAPQPNGENTNSGNPGKQRGPKPSNADGEATPAPKKRGRKPKVAAE